MQFPNEYRDPIEETVKTTSDHVPTRHLVSGHVWIITDCDKPPKGYMLKDKASIISRGSAMRTRRF